MTRNSVRIALACAIAVSLFWSLKSLKPVVPIDFEVYLTAAHLARSPGGVAIYNSADTGANPQVRTAPDGSLFSTTAAQLGYQPIMLYLYPPFLADAMVPFTYVSPAVAWRLYLALHVGVFAATGLLLAWLLDWPLLSLRTLALVIAAALFRPCIAALQIGQILVVMLLLWTIGIVAAAKGFRRISAVALGIATAIKLTPLLVIVPFLIWREWRWLRWYAGTLAASIALTLVVSGPAALADFTRNVMPSMSAGFMDVANLSLQSATQMAVSGLMGADTSLKFMPPAPHWLVLLSKALAACVLAAFAFAVLRLHRRFPAPNSQQIAAILALTALVSAFASPVSWRSAYTVVFPLLLLLWQDALRRPPALAPLVLLMFCTVECSFAFDSVLAHYLRGPLLGFVPLLVPVCGIALTAYTLAVVNNEGRPKAASA